MKPVFCFGEILLRMSPALNGAWIHDAGMPVYIGGSELNVANALASWRVPVEYCSAAPDHYLTQEMMTWLQGKNVDVSKFIYCGDRIGVYYLPQGTDLKHAGVIYDRAHSSFSSLKPGMIDWDKMLDGVKWFHFSAISPALNAGVAAVCAEALEAATAKQLFISVDLNYRAKLWQYGTTPPEIMHELVSHCDLVMGNIWSAGSLLGLPVNNTLLEAKNKTSWLEHSAETAGMMQKLYSRCKFVANTFRFDAGDGIHYFAALHDTDNMYVSQECRIDKVIDKVGSGDCFMAGLIYGLYRQLPLQQVVDFAATAATGKMLETGDVTSQTVEDIMRRMA